MRLDDKGREMIGGMGCEGELEKNRRGHAWERGRGQACRIKQTIFAHYNWVSKILAFDMFDADTVRILYVSCIISIFNILAFFNNENILKKLSLLYILLCPLFSHM